MLVSQSENTEPKDVQVFRLDIMTAGETFSGSLTDISAVQQTAVCKDCVCVCVCPDDEGFLRKQKHMRAQAFAIKMRPRKEVLEVNYVSMTFVCHKIL